MEDVMDVLERLQGVKGLHGSISECLCGMAPLPLSSFIGSLLHRVQ